jgi:MFS family permease
MSPQPAVSSVEPTPSARFGIGSQVSATAAGPLHRAPLLSWRLGLVLAVLFTFGLCFSTFLLLPKYLATALGAGAQAIGHVSATGMAAAVLCVPLVGKWIDRYPRRRLIVLGCTLMALASSGFVWVGEVGPYVLVLRLGQGLAFAMVFNACAALVTDLAPAPRLGQALGLFGVAMLSTNAIAPMLAEAIAARSGYKPVFALAAASAAAAALIGSQVHERTAAAEPSRHDEARPRRQLPLWAVAAVAGGAFGTLFTFTQPLALELGVDRFSGFFASYTLAALSVRLGLGRLVDRVGRARMSVAALLAYGLVTISGAALRPGWLVPLGLAFGVAHGLFYPAICALAAEGVSSRRRGSALTFLNGAFNAGLTVSVAGLGGVAEEHGYEVVFLSVGLLTLGAAGWLRRITLHLRCSATSS